MTCLVRLSCRPPTPLPPAPPSPSSLCRLPPPSRPVFPPPVRRPPRLPSALFFSSPSGRRLPRRLPVGFGLSRSSLLRLASRLHLVGRLSTTWLVWVWAVLGVWLPLARFRCCGQHGVVRFRQLTQIKHRRLDISVRHNACSAPGGDDRGRRARNDLAWGHLPTVAPLCYPSITQ
jgi:hypothetical protein